MARPVANFYASLGVNTRIQDIRKVDRYLKLLERKLEKFGKLSGKNIGLRLNTFKVDRKALVKELQSSLDRASRDVTLQITRFSFDQRRLQAAFSRASAGGVLAPRAGGNTYINNRVLGRDEWNRREAEKQRLWRERRNALREDEARRAAERASRPRAGNFSYSSMFQGGGVAGSIARYGMGSLPFIGGSYGLMQLNTANQEAISTRLTTQAVLQAQGFTERQGEQAFQWLKDLGNLNGFSYMQAAPDYNQFLSNSLGAGVSLGGSQDIFRGFSEYQTAMGVTPARRKLVNNALSQMLGKGVVSMEELRRQMAN